jgi:hypothetical protein
MPHAGPAKHRPEEGVFSGPFQWWCICRKTPRQYLLNLSEAQLISTKITKSRRSSTADILPFSSTRPSRSGHPSTTSRYRMFAEAMSMRVHWSGRRLFTWSAATLQTDTVHRSSGGVPSILPGSPSTEALFDRTSLERGGHAATWMLGLPGPTRSCAEWKSVDPHQARKHASKTLDTLHMQAPSRATCYQEYAEYVTIYRDVERFFPDHGISREMNPQIRHW